MSTRSRQEIEVEVEDLAQEVLENFEGVTYAEARASVWEHCPELYDEFTTAAPERPAGAVVKADRPLALADAIADAVDREADRQSWREWPERPSSRSEPTFGSAPRGRPCISSRRIGATRSTGAPAWPSRRGRTTPGPYWRSGGGDYAHVGQDGVGSSRCLIHPHPQEEAGLASAGDRNQFDPSAQFDTFTQSPGCGQYLRFSSSCVLAVPRFFPAHGPR